ncbi:hypothetical protein QQY79_23670, partial [Flavobacterium tructae]|uniref:immunoglobulin domain-containing protein n=1 Tax=Flavobacterium tructae TaxID=1114873 RepID=UPI003D7DE0CD|nr:hypothetical protein [Flavobacterium tructae]
MKSTLLKMIIVLLCLLSLKGHSQLVVINADCKGAGSIEFPQIVPADKNMTVNYIVEQQNENGDFSAMTNSMSEWKFWAWAGSYRCSYETYYYNWTTGVKSGSETHPLGIVTITKDSDTKPPTGKSTQYFLGSSSPTVGSLRVWVDGGYINEIWYDAATGGNVLARTTLLENNKTYYVSSKAGNGCPESTARFAVTVKLINPQAPTGSTSQSFCADSNPTVANLVTNETSVVWYDASAGGNVVPSTTPLVNGTTYYGAIEESFYNEYTVYSLKSFVSPTRLAVTVAISNNPAAPTGITSQTFCANTNATVSNLSATGTAIKWYDAAIGGNVVTLSTALTNGTIYYASQTVNGCESTTRLAVTVTISDPQTPTGTAAQEFCKSANATVASLQTNESGVTWYDAATAGNVVTSTTALVNGTTYYGSLRSGTCESPTRLAVTVTISDPQTPTGTASQEFYKSSNATVASLVTNERGVTWFDAATAGNVVPSTTILTNGTTYYGSLKTGTCESPTRLAITIKLKEDPKTATTANPTQEFLNSKNPTVADLKVNE